jgi:hypothetical protein
MAITTADKLALKNTRWSRDCFDWVTNAEIKNEKGEVLEFEDRKFLKDIYSDFSQIQVARKCSQIGFTVMKALKTMWAARYMNLNIIYTFPTFSDVTKMIPSKINPLIEQNPILGFWTKDKDSIFQKKIGKAFIHYRGTKGHTISKKDDEATAAGVGIMISSDLNVHDECDRSDQLIMEQYESRLAASNFQGRWYFSNPTTPGTISQKIFEKSDQKHWFVKCEHCGAWQYMDYWKNVQGYQFICQKCKGIISDRTRGDGMWVKRYRNRDISGYWINHMMCPWISAKEIQETYETKSKQYFYNFVMGLPYIGSEVCVNRDVILKNIDLTAVNYKKHNILGCDSGLKKHWVLGNEQGIFRIGVAKDWAEIEDLIKTYDTEIVVVDALPDLTEPRKLREKYLGKVWLNYYKKDVRKADFINWDEKTFTVYCDRSKIIQQVISEMVDRKIRFYMPPEDLKMYIAHWESMYKATEQDSLGIDRDVWDSTGEDHFVHATNYFRLGLERIKGGSGLMTEWKKEEKINSGLAPEVAKLVKGQDDKFII